jgi:hypothetical protein
VAIGGDGVLDDIRLGFVLLWEAVQVLGQLGESSRGQLLPEVLDRGRTKLQPLVLSGVRSVA